MGDLGKRIGRASEGIDPGWDEATVDRTLAGVRQRLRARERRQGRLKWAALGGMAAAFGATLLLIGGRVPDRDDAGVAVAPKARPSSGVGTPAGPGPEPGGGFGTAHSRAGQEVRTIRLRDGSRIVALQPDSELAVVLDQPSRAVVEIGRGRGRFEVVPGRRPLSVRAGEVTITVLGTVFTVERVADRIGVAVERGRVEVRWATGVRQLGATQAGWFPPLTATPAESAPVPPTIGAPATARAPRAAAAPARAVASAAAPAAAAGAANARARQTSASRSAAEPVTPATAEALMAAADEARMAGQPERAAQLLTELLAEHEADPAMAVAAFTLGRVLLLELGRYPEAAAVFAQARGLAPEGAFAEDALAREVESWAKAGQTARARDKAQTYLRLYPHGRRTDEVKAQGGLE